MNWKIISKVIDVAELSPTDHQNIYLVYVRDGLGNNMAKTIEHRLQKNLYISMDLKELIR